MNRGCLLLACVALLALPAVAAVPVAPRAAVPGVVAANPAPDITVNVSPQNPEVGLVMRVLVTVSGAEGTDCNLLALPQVHGARLVSLGAPRSERSFSLSSRGSRSSIRTQWQFELVPEVPGPFVLPPFRFNCRGTEVESQSVQMEVGLGSLQPEIATLDVRASTQELWVGQVVELSVVAGVSAEFEENIPRGGLEFELPWLSGVPGLHPREIPTPACRSVFAMSTNGGRDKVPVCQTREASGRGTQLMFRATVPLLATQAGTITLPESRFSVRLVVESRVERDPFFQIMGRSSVVPTRVLVTDGIAPSQVITVRPTPLAGRPDSFTNAVGRFQLDADARPTSLAVGESCSLRLKLEAEGRMRTNLDLVEWPEYQELGDQFRLFGKDERTSGGARYLEFEISPKDTTVTEIPQLAFSFFDPDTGRYQTLTVGPFPLDVKPGGDLGLTNLELPPEVLNDLETIRESLPAPAGGSWPAWGAPLLALVGLAVVELRSRSTRWKERHPDAVLRRGARSTLERKLQEADGPPAVAAAFARYLSARLDGPPAGLTAEEAAERLGEDELATELKRVVNGWEAAYLGGATLDLNAVRAEARALAEQLESVT